MSLNEHIQEHMSRIQQLISDSEKHGVVVDHVFRQVGEIKERILFQDESKLAVILIVFADGGPTWAIQLQAAEQAVKEFEGEEIKETLLEMLGALGRFIKENREKAIAYGKPFLLMHPATEHMVPA